MDGASFDRLIRILGTSGTRRSALGALLGAGLTSSLCPAAARRKDRKPKARKRDRARAGRVGAEAADCLGPGPSSNMSGCDFAGEDFSGDDLSGSSMAGTVFRNAELGSANLSSSNMRGANFRGANLRCADLSSSVLRDADFRGFAAPGRATNLFGADLSSSGGCGTIRTNARTLFCGTTMCNGAVRNDHCPPGVDPENICCADAGCGADQLCQGGVCEACDVCERGCAYQAVDDAVNDPNGPTTIRICPGTYLSVGGTIERNLTLIGAGAATTIVDGQGGGDVFFIHQGVEVLMQDLTVTRATKGGIHNHGALTLRRVVVTGHTSEDSGGGIFNAGTLTLEAGSSVRGNTAGGAGGGIFSTGSATLESGSSVTGNRAGDGGGGVFESAGAITVANPGIVTNNTLLDGTTPNNCRPEGAVPNCIG